MICSFVGLCSKPLSLDSKGFESLGVQQARRRFPFFIFLVVSALTVWIAGADTIKEKIDDLLDQAWF